MAAKTASKKAVAPKGAAPAIGVEAPVVPVAGSDDAGTAPPSYPPSRGESVTYRVISPLRHNGERYRVGALIELGAAEADRLLALRVVTDESTEG